MAAPTEGQTGLTSVKYNGFTWSDGTYTTKVMTISPDGYVQSCYGATKPDGTAGYAIGGLFYHSDGGSGTALYVNNGTVASCSFSAVPTAAGTTATALTAANEATDTSCYPVFVTAATGDLGPKTNAGLTFNSNTGVLTATGFSGPLTGSITGNAATVTVDATTTDTTCFVMLAESASGSLEPQTDATLTYNATTGALTATSFVGALTGAVTGSGAGLTANTVKPTALPNAATDLGDATITVDISNSNGANVTNFVTDGSITGGSLVTATSTTTGSLISTPVDSDFAEGNAALAVGSKMVMTVDGAGAGSAITSITGGTAGQVLIIAGICTTADVSLTDGANLQMAGGTGPTLSTNDTVMLVCVDGTKWVEVCRSNN